MHEICCVPMSVRGTLNGACCCYLWFFFFSSRRRHTRFKCDWSSDVCSSDLVRCPRASLGRPTSVRSQGRRLLLEAAPRTVCHETLRRGQHQGNRRTCRGHREIGRASCRERG